MVKAQFANKGYSLVELLIYIGILGTVMISLVYFMISLSNVFIKNFVKQEVQANGRLALQIISERIHASNGVNLGSSVFDSDPGVLSLSMADAGKNPTIFDLTADDGALEIKEGAAAYVPLTNSKVKITNLVFKSLGQGLGRRNISVELTIEYNATGDVRYNYSESFRTAVNLRQ